MMRRRDAAWPAAPCATSFGLVANATSFGRKHTAAARQIGSLFHLFF